MFCDVHRVRDGKISRTRSYFDVAGMLVRLGLMPAPEERRVARRERV